MSNSHKSGSRKQRRSLSEKITEGSKRMKKSETEVTSTINLRLYIKAIKRYSHREGSRTAKKEFDCIFTETEVNITNSSFEDATPEQDEEDKEALCQDSLFSDKLVHRNSNHIHFDKFALVKSTWILIACLIH